MAEKPSIFEKLPVWEVVKEHEEKVSREEAISGLLRLHRYASKLTKGSDEWLNYLRFAQEHYERTLKRGKGRPDRKRDLDDLAIAYMVAMNYLTGETSSRRLAEKAIEAEQVPKKGSLATRIDRLARKYAAYKRRPRPLNLDGGPDEKPWIRTSEWPVLKLLAWEHAMEEQLVLHHARDLRAFLQKGPAIEQKFDWPDLPD